MPNSSNFKNCESAWTLLTDDVKIRLYVGSFFCLIKQFDCSIFNLFIVNVINTSAISIMILSGLGIMGAFLFIATNEEFHRGVESKLKRNILKAHSNTDGTTFLEEVRLTGSVSSKVGQAPAYGDKRRDLYYQNEKQPINNPQSQQEYPETLTKSRQEISSRILQPPQEYVSEETQHIPRLYHNTVGRHPIEQLTHGISPSSTPCGSPTLESIPEGGELSSDQFRLDCPWCIDWNLRDSGKRLTRA